MIEVYVAGASRNWQRARAFIERCHATARIRITYDWTISVEAASVPDEALTARQRAEFARLDLDAIARADVLVVLLDASVQSVGRWVELGYALRMRDEWSALASRGNEPGPQLRIIVSGGQRLSIFTAPGLVDFEHTFSPGAHDDDAFFAVVQYATKGLP